MISDLQRQDANYPSIKSDMPHVALDAGMISDLQRQDANYPSIKSDMRHATQHFLAPFTSKLFMEESKTNRFSLCFNDGGQPGAMRLNVPELQNPIPNIGTTHWGTGVFGISVGNNYVADLQATTTFATKLRDSCDVNNMKPHQNTPCGAIPDSGTTLLMGPEDQIVDVFGALCEKWERCSTAIGQGGDLENMDAPNAFSQLLYDCDSWIYDSSIDEVPSVFFTVGTQEGAPGPGQKTLELTPWSYVIEMEQVIYKRTVKHLGPK